jgi:glutamyl-tRNA synthetase
LFNYLFAKKHGGTFVLRIEDTDQGRYVKGAEEYILNCLAWCGISPDEGPHKQGEYGPYRQSERKARYLSYAKKLVQMGYAYYAFDTPEELDQMREKFKTLTNPSPQYNALTRAEMKNSLTLSEDEVTKNIENGVPYVIRIKMPTTENIVLNDMIRGEVIFNSDEVDDKVLLKADGMPTYHLAVVVDDYEMQISHAFRGEEWLPSAPVHILLWEYLGWKNQMPQWAHFPLILKPDGKGKLSKRDGDRLGFPVYAMDWTDPKSGEITKGFKEMGFLPEAFINLLALLGWNDGTSQEIFELTELTEKFSIDRIHKGGAKFDFEKAKWFNGEWIKKSSANDLLPLVKKILETNNLYSSEEKIVALIPLVKDRCQLLNDFYTHLSYFFQDPQEIDLSAIKAIWDETKSGFLKGWIEELKSTSEWTSIKLEDSFKQAIASTQLKAGELQLPLRIMLVGGKFGPPVFEIASIIGKDSTIRRIEHSLRLLN